MKYRFLKQLATRHLSKFETTVEPRFSVCFGGMGKMYAISKCPLYQGFIPNQSNIEKNCLLLSGYALPSSVYNRQ